MLIGRAEVANRVATNLLARCAREELENSQGTIGTFEERKKDYIRYLCNATKVAYTPRLSREDAKHL